MNGLFISMLCLASGISVVVMPRFEPEAYVRALSLYKCTFLTGIPTMFAMLYRQTALVEGEDFSFVRNIILGSAPLSEKLVHELRAIFPNAEVQNAFGTTEGGAYVFGRHPGGLSTPTLSLGCAAEGIEVELVGGSTPDDGVLRLRSPALMQGYLNLPEQTMQRLHNGWYDTGDVMRRDANGFFYYVGRADDMFICGGENIYPREIESLLERHSEILEAAVVAVPDAVKGQIPVAFVVRKTGSTISERDVQEFALREGPAFSHPRHVQFLDALPVAASLKHDRRSLIARALELV
jgi:acyl-CoA synthetase (AMP-forming)/AMP-acid ligase II